MNRFRLAQRVRRITKRALASRSQKPEITARARCPAAGTPRPVVFVLVMPTDESDSATAFVEMRRRFPHDQLRNRVAAHTRILKHQARFRRNDEGRIGHDQIELLIVHRLEKAPLPERHIFYPVESRVHPRKIEGSRVGIGRHDALRMGRCEQRVNACARTHVERRRHSIPKRLSGSAK